MNRVRHAIGTLCLAPSALTRRGVDAAVDAAMRGFHAYFWLASRWRIAVPVGLSIGAAIIVALAGMRGDSAPSGDRHASGPVVRIEAPGTGTGTAMVLVATNASPGGLAPSSPSRLALIRALQTGLVRADCYDGDANGIWTRRSKEAMRTFVTALNAKLPVETPDQVLLALVEANPGRICSQGRVAAGSAPPVAAVAAATAAAPAVAAALAPPLTPPVASAQPPAKPPAPPQADRPSRPSEAPAARDDSRTRAAPSPAPDTAPPAAQADRERPPKAGQSQASKPPRRARPQQSHSEFNTVAKSMSKSFKSLQRSIASIFK